MLYMYATRGVGGGGGGKSLAAWRGSGGLVGPLDGVFPCTVVECVSMCW